ncbi:MAG TPA: hypothetical protein VJT11_05970 [Nitrospiraceae bacterium]|nr:hypothetical protein [Nitrospiraceae bacterium]
MNDESDQVSSYSPSATATAPSAGDSTPIYFPVSLTKFIVMHFCTVGMYQLYWFHENWKLVLERERSDASPFWKTFFMFIYCYTLFEKVQRSAVSLKIPHSISVHVLATGWILLSALWLLPDPYGLVALVSIVFLIPVQQAANRVNEFLAPNHERNDRFTALNIVAVVIGGLLLATVVVGAFVLKV